MSPEAETKESTEDTFSGCITLLTSAGPLVIDIHSATVIEGKTILERNRIPNQPDEDVIKVTYQQLGSAIDTLPETKPNREKADRNWVRKRTAAIQEHGEHSICNLLPEDLHKDTAPLVRLVNTLRRRGFQTMEDLAKPSLAELRNIRNIGERTMPLLTAMRNVAALELIRLRNLKKEPEEPSIT